MRITKRKNVHVPWLELARSPAEYLDASTIPNDYKVFDPSKMTRFTIEQLWTHWTRRARTDEPILVFTKGRSQDMGVSPGYTDPHQRHPINAINALKAGRDYVEIGDDDAGYEEPDGHARKRSNVADKGEEVSGPENRPPPSKRPRLSGQATVLDDDSPAANSSNRPVYLSSLSSEPPFRTLVDAVLALPALVSFVIFISVIV